MTIENVVTSQGLFNMGIIISVFFLFEVATSESGKCMCKMKAETIFDAANLGMSSSYISHPSARCSRHCGIW